jgi:long-subunit fatty acid transport protein
MKKQFLLITGLASLAAMAFGGGIVTNTNQSAAWVRTLVRDASTDADAVYYNPAGLTKLNDGFHFSLNSQTIFQNKDVTSNYLYLDPSPKKYEGKVAAPIFPGVYATWKKNRLAVSFGFNPVGGGGGADYAEGLPSFEESISDLVPTLSEALSMFDTQLMNDPPNGYGFDPGFRNVTGYRADINFEGTSVYFGYQGGLTYKINDMFSLFAGARYVSVKNTYQGQIKDIQIYASPNVPPAPVYDIPAGYYTAGDYTRAIAGAQGIQGSPWEAYLTGAATTLDAMTGDREVDVKETGNGITPMLGANISLGEKLNIGLKYEFKTTIDLNTEIIDGKDGGGLFIQDSTVHSDMPAMVSVGVSYKILPNLRASAGFHYYFDKAANFGKSVDSTGVQVSNEELMDDNFFEFSLGLEYNVTEKFIISGGWLHANTGVTEDYQSDMSFSLTSNTFGAGIGYRFNENLMINLGGAYVMYQEGEKTRNHTREGFMFPTDYQVVDTYYKDTLFFGLGLDISF